jgi:cytochrome c-type biogenesis protein CcmH
MKKLFLLLIILMTPMLPSFAAEEYYHFESLQAQKNFNQLTTELRCLVCQNQNLAESNAPLANDLRKQIYDQINHGQSNQQIIDYLVSRYGDFILYKPPVNAATLGLWFAPLLLLIAGISYLLFYLHKNKKRD